MILFAGITTSDAPTAYTTLLRPRNNREKAGRLGRVRTLTKIEPRLFGVPVATVGRLQSFCGNSELSLVRDSNYRRAVSVVNNSIVVPPRVPHLNSKAQMRRWNIPSKNVLGLVV